MLSDELENRIRDDLESRLETIAPEQREAFREAIPGIIAEIRERVALKLEYDRAYKFDLGAEIEISLENWTRKETLSSVYSRYTEQMLNQGKKVLPENRFLKGWKHTKKTPMERFLVLEEKKVKIRSRVLLHPDNETCTVVGTSIDCGVNLEKKDGSVVNDVSPYRIEVLDSDKDD